RCGSTLLQSMVNAHPSFAIWGEHNAFLRPIADAYYMTKSSITWRNSSHQNSNTADRASRLRDVRHWSAWENPVDLASLEIQFRDFVTSIFQTASIDQRWGFKEIRYGMSAGDRTLDFLRTCFPAARFLIIVRHPAETLFSILSAWYRECGLNAFLIEE